MTPVSRKEHAHAWSEQKTGTSVGASATIWTATGRSDGEEQWT